MKCELSLKIWERLKKYNGHVSDTRESPTLIPYPSFEAHQYEAGSVPEIISPFRIRVDRCERLWVLDTGFTDILQNPEQEAPPALLIYDLKNDRLLRKFVIPEDQKTHDSLFANIALEDYSCEDTFAYLGDLGGPGLVVYSWKSRKSWLVKHRFFQPDPQVSMVFFIVFSSLFIFIDLVPPLFSSIFLFFFPIFKSEEFNVSGISFQWTDGLFGMSIAPSNDGYSVMYFHPLSSTMEYSVSTKILRDSERANSPGKSIYFNIVSSISWSIHFHVSRFQTTSKNFVLSDLEDTMVRVASVFWTRTPEFFSTRWPI